MSLDARSGRYRVRHASSAQDFAALHRFRARCFGLDQNRDVDEFDDACLHVLVETAVSGRIVCCFRLLPLEAGDIARSYSAQYYELSALSAFEGRMVELGRFCVDPACTDPDVVRLAWAYLTRFVDAEGFGMLIGCASFAGTETGRYLDAFAMLKERHLAPPRWLPRVKAPDVFRYAARLRRRPDLKRAMRHMPPLLRSYLSMGGWVSDHAVIDHQMKTLHVFTGLEVDAIPQTRKRLLRALV